MILDVQVSIVPNGVGFKVKDHVLSLVNPESGKDKIGITLDDLSTKIYDLPIFIATHAEEVFSQLHNFFSMYIKEKE